MSITLESLARDCHTVLAASDTPQGRAQVAALVGNALREAPGKVRRTRTYTLRPGDVHVYNEDAVHAPSRRGPTRLVRVEGMDMARVARGSYEVVA